MALQWGRELTLPEIRTDATDTAACAELQWGRELTLPEICITRSNPRNHASFNGAGS